MKKNVGLWIDRRKAVIVTIFHIEDGMQRVQANLEKNVCFFERSSWRDPEVNLRDSRFDNSFNNYYADVTSYMLDAESIQIFGPGDAKYDLEKRLQREKLGNRIVGIESAEKMTDRQIEAKVWQHYLTME